LTYSLEWSSFSVVVIWCLAYRREDEAVDLLQRALNDRPTEDSSALSRVALLGELSGLQTGRCDLDSARALDGEADELMSRVRAKTRDGVDATQGNERDGHESKLSVRSRREDGIVSLGESKLSDGPNRQPVEGRARTSSRDVAADGVRPESLPLPNGTPIEVRAKNEDELFYGAVVSGYDSDADTYQVTYEGDEGEIEEGLFLKSMLVGDTRRTVVKNEVLEVLDGHVLFRVRI
jgi:hypothetical protein